jgi:hypothetical protein
MERRGCTRRALQSCPAVVPCQDATPAPVCGMAAVASQRAAAAAGATLFANDPNATTLICSSRRRASAQDSFSTQHKYTSAVTSPDPSFCTQDAEQQRIALNFWMGNTVALSFHGWREAVKRCCLHRHILTTVMSRWMHRFLAIAFHGWHKKVLREQTLTALTARAVAIWRKQSISQAWNAWLGWCLERLCVSGAL